MGTGDRGPTVTDQEILAVFANVDEEVLRTRTVAKELPIGVGDVEDRLDDLRERGLIESDDDEPRDRWWLAPGAAEEVTIPDERVETEVEAQATKVTDAATATREEETPETPPPDPDADALGPVRETPTSEIEAFDAPGTGAEQERHREALERAYLYVRKRGAAGGADLEEDVYPQAPGQFDDPAAWRAELVEPGLETLPGVERTDDGWRSVGGAESGDGGEPAFEE